VDQWLRLHDPRETLTVHLDHPMKTERSGSTLRTCLLWLVRGSAIRTRDSAAGGGEVDRSPRGARGGFRWPGRLGKTWRTLRQDWGSRNEGEATGRWRGRSSADRDTPASNRGRQSARQGKIRAGVGQLPQV
jgi:hypothetical protein